MNSLWYYITSAFRNLAVTRWRKLLPMAGFSLGSAFTIVVFLSIIYESGWDRHFPGHQLIYRMASVVSIGNNQALVARTPYPLCALVRQQSEVEYSTQFYESSRGVVRANGHSYQERRFFYGDSCFFSLFEMKFVHGAAHTAFRCNNSVVLTSTTAKKYFGNINPIGRELTFLDSLFVVTAVVEDVPDNTHFHFDFLGNISQMPMPAHSEDERTVGSPRDNWLQLNGFCYVKIKEPIDVSRFCERVNHQKDVLAHDQVEEVRRLQRMPDQPFVIDFVAEPLVDIHSKSKAELSIEPGVDLSRLHIFGFFSFLILLFTAINFYHVLSSGAPERNASFQARLMMGATRNQLFIQLMTEIVINSFLAVFFSLVLVELILPVVNSVFDVKLGLWSASLKSLPFLIFLFLIAVGSALIPARQYVYGFSPLNGLRQAKRTNPIVFQGFILFFQISVAVFLFVVLTGMWRQLNALQKLYPGYDSKSILVVEHDNMLHESWPEFKKSLMNIRGVEAVSSAYSIPGMLHSSVSCRIGSRGDESVGLTTTNVVGQDYYEVMGYSLLNGVFPSYTGADTLTVVINQATVVKYRLTKPIGETVEVGYDSQGRPIERIVKGVVKDFFYDAFSQPINPMLMMTTPSDEPLRYILIRKSSAFDAHSLSDISKLWSHYVKDVPVLIRDMDQYRDVQFETDWHVMGIGIVVMIIAMYVMLSGMLVFADSWFENNISDLRQRIICGASISRLVAQLSSSIVVMVLMAGAMGALPALALLEVYRVDNSPLESISSSLFVLSLLINVLLPLAVFSTNIYFLLAKRNIIRM